MLIDGIELAEGSQIKNPALATGPDFPANADKGELFYNETLQALCINDGTNWVVLGAVRLVAGRSGEVVLDVTDVANAVAVAQIGAMNGVASLNGQTQVPDDQINAYNKNTSDARFVHQDQVGVANGIPTLNTVGQVPDEQVNTYTKIEIDQKVGSATTAQYHATPYDIASAVVNKPAGGAKVLRFVAPRAFKIITNAVGSIFRAGAVSTGTVIFGLFKNTTQIGTVTFSAGAAIATCVITETTFGIGDVLGMVAQPVQDATLADVMFTISAQL